MSQPSQLTMASLSLEIYGSSWLLVHFVKLILLGCPCGTCNNNNAKQNNVEFNFNTLRWNPKLRCILPTLLFYPRNIILNCHRWVANFFVVLNPPQLLPKVLHNYLFIYLFIYYNLMAVSKVKAIRTIRKVNELQRPHIKCSKTWLFYD